MIISKINTNIDKIVDFHIKNFNNSIVNYFDKSYVKDFYEYILKSNTEYLFVLYDEANNVVGIAVISLDVNNLKYNLLYNTSLLKHILLSPVKTCKLFLKVIQKIKIRFNKKLIHYNNELIMIFTDSDRRSTGLGSELLKLIQKELINININHYYIKTLNDIDNKAISFYNKMCFKLVDKMNYLGDEYLVYKCELKK